MLTLSKIKVHVCGLSPSHKGSSTLLCQRAQSNAQDVMTFIKYAEIILHHLYNN